MDSCSISSTGFGHVNGNCENMVGSLLRHKYVKDWPESEDELDVMRMMRDQGSNTIVIIGDSVAGQHIRTTHCNLKRAGVTLLPVDESWKEIYHLRDYLAGNAFKVQDPFINGTGVSDDKLPYFQFILFGPYFHISFKEQREMFKNITESIQTFPLVKGKVLYIYNFGLHFLHESPNIDMFANVSTGVLLESAKQGHTVVFRETSAQHFHTPTGLFDPALIVTVPQVSDTEKQQFVSPVKHNFNRLNNELLSTQHGRDTVDFNKLNKTMLQHTRCKRIESEEALDKQNWRNKHAHKIINELDPTHEYIGIDNFYRVSAARNDLHLHAGKHPDCTHFCNSPMLWAPTWDYIAKYYRKKHGVKQFRELICYLA